VAQRERRTIVTEPRYCRNSRTNRAPLSRLVVFAVYLPIPRQIREWLVRRISSCAPGHRNYPERRVCCAAEDFKVILKVDHSGAVETVAARPVNFANPAG
jgi:hypothetical protein